MRPWGWIIIANLFFHGDMGAFMEVMKREGDTHWILDYWRVIGSNIEAMIQAASFL